MAADVVAIQLAHKNVEEKKEGQKKKELRQLVVI